MFDILNYLNEWCDSTNVEGCKVILQDMAEKKQIFLGEFVKALLKINNISCGMNGVKIIYLCLIRNQP